MPTWVLILGCLALGEWSHHCGYLGYEDLLYSSSVYFCHLFLISFAFIRPIPFLSFIVPIFAWNVPLVSLIFLKRSLVFPILLFSSISFKRIKPGYILVFIKTIFIKTDKNSYVLIYFKKIFVNHVSLKDASKIKHLKIPLQNIRKI